MTDPTWREQRHYTCDDCGAFPEAKALTADHPFVTGEQVYGCPRCGDIAICQACDWAGCNRGATSGTPTDAGYRFACSTHRPEVES